MKRIISAYLEQTLKFETEENYQAYIHGLERKQTKFKIVDRQMQPDSTVIIKIIKNLK